MNPELEVGDRIVLLAMSGEDLIAGIKGTVTRKSFVIDQIQYSMDWDNILEMPIHHDSAITTKEEIDTII